jgi:hypothetical protein
MKEIALRLLTCLLLAPLSALAVPISYIYSGVGSGSLAGNAFSTSFVIEAQADTDNVAPWVNATVQNTHLSAKISIGGIGTFAFTQPSHTWAAAGFGGGIGEDLSINWLTLWNAPMGSYDLVSNFTSTGAGDTSGQFVNVATTGGLLSVSSLQGAVTFEARLGASPVPEPMTWVLFGIGLAGLGVARGRQLR